MRVSKTVTYCCWLLFGLVVGDKKTLRPRPPSPFLSDFITRVCEIQHIFFQALAGEKLNNTSLPHDFFGCCEIRNKHIFKAGLANATLHIMLWPIRVSKHSISEP